MGSLSLISLNVERSKHLDRIIPFLEERGPDVFCVQELCEMDIERIRSTVGAYYQFVPMAFYEEVNGQVGLGIFSSLPIHAPQIFYYRGGESTIPTFDATSAETKYHTENMMLLLCEIEKDGVRYRVGTTHFTWSPDGEANDFQRKDLQVLLPLLKQNEPFVFCGDLNAPRGREMYREFATRYTDAVPMHYKTSIDIALHRNGKTKSHELANNMVDYIFTTSPYIATNVELVCGVSDHCAVIGNVQRSRVT